MDGDDYIRIILLIICMCLLITIRADTQKKENSVTIILTILNFIVVTRCSAAIDEG